jgi:hypothetical protein
MSADCSLQVVESQHRSGDLILANDSPRLLISVELSATQL